MHTYSCTDIRAYKYTYTNTCIHTCTYTDCLLRTIITTNQKWQCTQRCVFEMWRHMIYMNMGCHQSTPTSHRARRLYLKFDGHVRWWPQQHRNHPQEHRSYHVLRWHCSEHCRYGVKICATWPRCFWTTSISTMTSIPFSFTSSANVSTHDCRCIVFAIAFLYYGSTRILRMWVFLFHEFEYARL